MTEPSDLVKRAEELRARESTVGGPDAMVASLVTGMRRQARIIKLLWVSVVLDVVLSLAVIVGGARIVQTTERSQQNSRIASAACAAGNAFRANDHALWTFVLNLPSTPGLSAAQVAARDRNAAALNRYLDTVFAPRHCP